MWWRWTKERRGTARTLFLTGGVWGPRVYLVWCLLLCLVTGRGGVEVVSIQGADVQW